MMDLSSPEPKIIDSPEPLEIKDLAPDPLPPKKEDNAEADRSAELPPEEDC